VDLFDYGLSPSQYMAAVYLQKVQGRASGREIAERLGVSRRTGERILSSLADKGLILRVGHTRYALLWMTQTATPVTQTASSVTQMKVLSSSTATSMQVGMSNDIPTSAARPFEGIHIEKRFPMADDIEPGRLKPKPGKPTKRPLFKKPDKYHRLNQPREEWGIPHLVKEFEIRSQHAFPDSIYVPEGRRLSTTLAMAQRDFGLTVTQILTAMDQFFTHHSSGTPDHVSPTRHFLAYLKEYIRQQPGNGDKVFDFDNATLERDGYE